MPTKSAIDKVNALISNEVSARARPAPISMPKERVIPDLYMPLRSPTYGEQAEFDLGITDEEAQAYFFPPSAGGKAKATVKKFNVISAKQMKEKKAAKKAEKKPAKPRPAPKPEAFKKSLTKAQRRAVENREIRNMAGAGKFVYRENKILRGKKAGTFEKFYFNPKTMVKIPASKGAPPSADYGYEVGTSKYM